MPVITVSTIAIAITTHAATRNGPDVSTQGSTNNPIATAWTAVLSLPPQLAGMTPRRITANRNRVTPSSRVRISTVTHHGTSPSIDRPISADQISALSARGSTNAPNSVAMP